MAKGLEMIVDNDLQKVLDEIRYGLTNIFRDSLKEIILYGSYATGRNDEDSDLDIMVLVDMDEDEIKTKQDKILDIAVDISIRYGIVLSIVENNHDYFYDWVEALPFFANIENEGIRIYGE